MKRFNPETMIIAVITGVLFLILGTFAPTYAQQDQKQKGKDQQEQQQQPQAKDRQEQPQQQQAKDRQEQPQQQAKDQQEQPQQTQAKDQQEQQAKDQQKQQQAKGQEKQQQAKSKKKKASGQQQQQTTGLKKQAADQQPKQQAASPQNPQTQQHPKAPQAQQATGLKKQQQQATQPSQKVQPVQKSEQRNVWQQDRASSWQTEHRTWQQRGGYNGYRIPEDHFHGYFGRDHGFRIYNLSLEIFGGRPRFQYEGYWFCVVDPWPEYWSADWYENDDVYIDYVGDGYYMYNRRYPRDRIAVNVYVN